MLNLHIDFCGCVLPAWNNVLEMLLIDVSYSIANDIFILHVLYTDFTKAFDAIDHTILVSKLFTVGFSAAIEKLVYAYLQNRSVYVYFNGFYNHLEFYMAQI